MSRQLDGLLPLSYRIDGNRDFRESFARGYLKAGLVVLDVGGGKRPFVDSKTKHALGLRIIGVDIDDGELQQAPSGAYDDVICCDVGYLDLVAVADLVICQAVLEHVNDTAAAIANMARALRPGGTLLLFIPCRNAIFARLNLLLSKRLKKWVLFTIFPQTRGGHGFDAVYDHCTPRDVTALAQAHGLTLLEKRFYYLSRYFAFFLPLYLLWRVWTVVFRAIAPDKAAETFSMAFQKSAQRIAPSTPQPAGSKRLESLDFSTDFSYEPRAATSGPNNVP